MVLCRLFGLVLAVLLIVVEASALLPPSSCPWWMRSGWEPSTVTPAELQSVYDCALTTRYPGDDSTFLHWVARDNENPAVVSLLLDRGADLMARDRLGRTPLHWAAWFNEPAVVGLLLARGADPNARDRGGATPLHGAAKRSRSPVVVGLLLDHGADATLRDAENRLPVDLAAENATLKGTAVYQRLLDASL